MIEGEIRRREGGRESETHVLMSGYSLSILWMRGRHIAAGQLKQTDNITCAAEQENMGTLQKVAERIICQGQKKTDDV